MILESRKVFKKILLFLCDKDLATYEKMIRLSVNDFLDFIEELIDEKKRIIDENKKLEQKIWRKK